MTTENDQVPSQVPDPQQQPAAPGATVEQPGAAEPPKGGLTFTHPQPSDDVDDVELTDAKAKAQAEETKGQGAGEGDQGQQQAQNQTAQGQQPQGAQQQQQPQQHADPVLIPKARFDEVNNKLRETELEAARWRGAAEARATMLPAAGQGGGQQQQAQPQAPTPEAQLATIHSEIDALAKRFDDGELSMAEFKRQERVLSAKETAIREETLVSKVRPAASSQSSDPNELYLTSLTAELETKHPWVNVFEEVGTDADWDYLKNIAIGNLTGRGVDPTKGMGRYELRKEIAQLADEYGPILVGKRAQAKGIALPGQQPASPQQPGGQQQQQQPSGQAQARASKLAAAAAHPPDVALLNGHAQDPGAPPTDASIEGMSEDDIGRLPVAVKRKMMGIAS